VAYQQNLAGSARRHLRAAQVLYDEDRAGTQPGCRAVAGYLFGLAAELAIKEMMRTSGIKPLTEQERRDDPFFAHFPELKTLLLNNVKGRRSAELKRLAENATLFQYWATDMRYAPTEGIKDRWVADWKASAEHLVNRMDFA
jgi:hypothetical protein